MTYRLCYKPTEETWCGDCMPFYEDGKFWIYHQRDNRNPVPLDGEPLSWSLASTEDFVHYEDHGVALHTGADTEQDQFIYAGSVMKKDDTYHAFYTGYNRDYIGTGKPSQVILHAVSDDLKKWKKLPELRIEPPKNNYEPDDWRDPFVLFDDEKKEYVMILAARSLKGPAVRRGCTVYLTSPDLKEWTFKGDFWAPNLFYTHEMPDLFEMNGLWYLLYSEYSDRHATRYRVGKTMYGPWVAPKDDLFDGRAYYAARTISDGNNRYLFGWIPTRANELDKNNWQWGGVLYVHQVIQRTDGSLGVKMPDRMLNEFKNTKESTLALPASVGRIDRREDVLLFGEHPASCVIDYTLQYEEGTREIGIKICENLEKDEGYELRIIPDQKLMRIDLSPDKPWYRMMNKGLERPIEIQPGEPFNVRIVADEDACVFYVNDTAVSGRMYKRTGCAATIYASGGRVEVKEAILRS